ncbi:MAG: hypothetical protein MJ219_00680 [Mycoplasmoidaceae bacterium]|nr:hypothetical protein [Mycoplasmoidaceae bacterium]
MKKSLLLIPTFLATTAAPLNCLVSCNKTNDIDVTEVYNKSIEYFVGSDYKGGMCSIPHPTGELDAIRA